MRAVSLLSMLVACSISPADAPQSAASLRGLSLERVNIQRDAYGVPYVRSLTDTGAFYGLGWAMASDRRLQMELAARGAQGRRAEFLGPNFAESDREQRVRMAWIVAERKAAALDEETLDLFESFAAGINRWTESQPSLPLFEEAGLRPEPWTVTHVVAMWPYLSSPYSPSSLEEASLYADFQADAADLGEDAAVDAWLSSIHPGVPSAGVVQLEDLSDDYVEAVLAYADRVGAGDGRLMDAGGEEAPAFSHAYAIAGQRTESGEAGLIADPQVPVLLPAFWYEFQLESPSFRVRGMGVPGSPGIAVGFSEAVAWGLTANGSDQADLYRLQPGRTTNSYVVDGVELAMSVSEEVIVVAGAPDELVTIRETRFGPVIDELLGEPEDSFAMRAVADEPDRATVVAMLDMMRATDLASFTKALDGWRVPTANLVAADAEGDVYYSLLGGFPVRSTASPLGGWVAQDGSTAATDWVDTIPHEFLPQVTTPSGGAVYSGNHRPVGDWYPLPLHLPRNTGGHTVRSARLRDQLAGDSTWTTERLIEDVQLDCVDHNRMRLLQLSRHVALVAPWSMSEDAHAVLDALVDWDGSMRSEVAGPTVAAAIPTNFRIGETGPVLQELYYGGAGGMTFFLDSMLASLEADPRFLPAKEELIFIDTVLARAASTLTVPVEERIATWQSETATLDLAWMADLDGETLLSDVGVTTDVLPCAWQGSIWSQSKQSYTQVVDFGGPDQSLLPVGASEDPDSRNFLSELDNWTDGALKPAPLRPDDVADQRVTVEVIRVR